MFEPIIAHRRMLVATDMEKYSQRDSVHQHESQRALVGATREAAVAVGLDLDSWAKQSTGDGQLFVLPADVNEATVVGRFVQEIPGLFRRGQQGLHFMTQVTIAIRRSRHVGGALTLRHVERRVQNLPHLLKSLRSHTRRPPV